MNLEDFLNIIDENNIEEFMISKGLGETELWEILIYMKPKINVDSEIEFLTVNETEGDIAFYKNNEKLISLFSIGHIIEELYDVLQLHRFENNHERVKRLIEYAINDA